MVTGNGEQERESGYAHAAEALMEAARVVAAGALTGDPVRHVLEAAITVVPAPDLCLAVPTERGDEFTIVTAVGGPCPSIGQTKPINLGVLGRTFRTGTTQLVSDVRLDPDYLAHA